MMKEEALLPQTSKRVHTYITYISLLVCDPLTQQYNHDAILAEDGQNAHTGHDDKMSAS